MLTEWLDCEAGRRAEESAGLLSLVGGVHVVPGFLGNRFPLAGPEARAVIVGLGPERDGASLLGLHAAGLLGIGYGLRQILDRLRERGIAVATVVASGGAARSPLVCQALADATGVPVAVAATPEPVLLGSAMLAAVAFEGQPSLRTAMAAMAGPTRLFAPEGGAVSQRRTDGASSAFETLQAAARAVREAEGMLA